MPRRVITAVTVLALSLLAPFAEAQDRSGEAAFLDWAARTKIVLAGTTHGLSASDVAALRHMIGDARVVALSEPPGFATPNGEPSQVKRQVVADDQRTAINCFP